MTITLAGSQKYPEITCTTQTEADAVARILRCTAVVGDVMRGRLNNREQSSLRELVARFEAAEQRRSADSWAHRIMVGYSADGGEVAPQTVTHNGQLLRLNGYGKAFRIDADRAAACGVQPQYSWARYAYYVPAYKPDNVVVIR